MENIQKTVTDATDEIHKTINENLTDLKSLETDMTKIPSSADSMTSHTASVKTVLENTTTTSKSAGTAASVSRLGTAEGAAATTSAAVNASPLPPSQPIEAAVSVLNGKGETSSEATTERVSASLISVKPELECQSANFQNFNAMGEAVQLNEAPGETNEAEYNTSTGIGHAHAVAERALVGDDFQSEEAKRRSPDGQGGSK